MTDEAIAEPSSTWVDALDKGLAAQEAGLGAPFAEGRARLMALQDRLKADIENPHGEAFPLELKVPNAETRAAMAEADEIVRSRKMRFVTADSLFADLEKKSGK